MGSNTREVPSLRLSRPTYPDYLCEKGERSLAHSVREGLTVVVHDVLVAKAHRRPLAVGLREASVTGGNIEPGVWYQPSAAEEGVIEARLRREHAQGNQRVEFVNGENVWEPIRKIRNVKRWDGYRYTDEIEIDSEELFAKAREQAERIISTQPLVIVDLS